MTDKCQFYEEQPNTTRRNFIGGDIQPFETTLIPYCEHPKHSPVDIKEACLLGDARLLKCEGDLDKCPIADKWDDLG